MRYLLAIIVPPFAMFTAGKVLQGIMCIILMCTFIGWPVASIWALFVVSSHQADRRTDRLVASLRR